MKKSKELQLIQEELDNINSIELKYDLDIMAYVNLLSFSQQNKLKIIIHRLSKVDAKSLKQKYKEEIEAYGISKVHFSPDQPDEIMSKTVSLDEIMQFESDNSITIPLELKVYLLCVSRSVFKRHLYWRDIELDNRHIRLMPTIVDPNEYYLESQLNLSEEEINALSHVEYDRKIDEMKSLTYGTKVLVIRNVGCGYNNHIILNTTDGNNIGQIWYDEFAADCYFHQISNSFFDYVMTYE